MEIKLGHFTNDLIDDLVMEGKTPGNSLSIHIPFSYAANLVALNWNDIFFAVLTEYFDKSAAVEYAVNLLCGGENSKSTVELAGINPDEIIKEELLQKIIVCGARTEEMETAKNKIMYVLLSLIFENKEVFEDSLRAIEIIYSDFGCPKAIEGLVRYMPAENKEAVCTEEQIYRDWEKYLSEQKHYFTTE